MPTKNVATNKRIITDFMYTCCDLRETHDQRPRANRNSPSAAGDGKHSETLVAVLSKSRRGELPVRGIAWLGLWLAEVFRLHLQEAVRAQKCDDFTVAAHPKGIPALVGKALPRRARGRAQCEKLLHLGL